MKKIMKYEKRTREQHMLNLRIQRNALNALQEISEDFLVKTFESESHCNLTFINTKFQAHVFSDQFTDDSCQKSDNTDQEHAVIKSITRKHDKH
jgi:hypothetical protein